MRQSFGLKQCFKKKNNYKFSFELKLLPKVMRLGHVGDNMANVAILNNSFTIFLNSIAAVSGFTIF